MNRTPRLSKSGIEYLDYAWNFYSGCHNWKNGVCPVGENCWAKKRTHRFVGIYPNGFEPAFYPEAFLSPLYLKKPSIIGCAFMGDLFGDWIDPGMMINVPMVPGLSQAEPLREQIFRAINQCPQHAFLFKTKCPWNLIKWSPFPSNCWVGVTATDTPMLYQALFYLADIKAKVRYISIEPFLNWSLKGYSLNGLAASLKVAVDWLIIGACTGTKADLLPLHHKTGLAMVKLNGNRWSLQPQIEHIEEIVRAADRARIPVFLKDNLVPLFRSGEPSYWAIDNSGFLRQEMPK